MRKWLKKYLPKHEEIRKQQGLGWLGKTLNDPDLWHLSRRSTSRGVAVGLFAAFIPLPLQMLLAVILGLLVRANLTIAIMMTWVTNPFTFVPINYTIYWIGNTILGHKTKALTQAEVVWDFSSAGAIWHSAMTWLGQFGKAYFVGLPVVALGAPLIGYLLVVLGWRINVNLQRRARKKRQRARLKRHN